MVDERDRRADGAGSDAGGRRWSWQATPSEHTVDIRNATVFLQWEKVHIEGWKRTRQPAASDVETAASHVPWFSIA